MPISPNQCRAARGLFAMSRQELAHASGVSLRTISSFEDGERLPTAANHAAVESALQRLGVMFRDDGGVQWFSPFSEPQSAAILALEVRSGPRMLSVPELISKTGCSLADLELLARLQILAGIDGYPLLTAIGLHMPALLRDHEARESARQAFTATINYSVRLDEGTVFHARTAAVFRIQEDGTLTWLFDQFVAPELRDEVIAGAREALRRHRERDPRIVGSFWR
jgi:transcriptional regulator with XRE-family HTH domain